MMSIDEALSIITGATYTSWIEHRTESGSWSRVRHQETQCTLDPAQVRYLAKNPLPDEKRRYLRNTPLPARIMLEHDEHTRIVGTVEYDKLNERRMTR